MNNDLCSLPVLPFDDLIGDNGRTAGLLSRWIYEIPTQPVRDDNEEILVFYMEGRQPSQTLTYGITLTKKCISNFPHYLCPMDLLRAECDTVKIVNIFDLQRHLTEIRRGSLRGAGKLYENGVISYSGSNVLDRPIFKSFNEKFNGYIYLPHPNIKSMTKLIEIVI